MRAAVLAAEGRSKLVYLVPFRDLVRVDDWAQPIRRILPATGVAAVYDAPVGYLGEARLAQRAAGLDLCPL